MQVFIILKWSPDSIPRIQVSGVTSIVIPHLFWSIVQMQAIRDEHMFNNKKKCVMVSLASKQKVHISVSDNLHFINISLVYTNRKLILYWKVFVLY
jgi:hypothetical protein